MKRLLHISLFLLGGMFAAKAQQLPQFSGFTVHKYILNPAVAGTENYIDLRLHYRRQWAGFENAPQTQLFSVHSSFDNSNAGVGGYAFNDTHGISKATGGGATYAHHFGLTDDLNLSFGLSGTFAQYGIDGGAVVLDNPNDNLVNIGLRSTSNIFNLGFGSYLYHQNYWFGISSLQLLPSKPAYFETATQQFRTHTYIMGGYRFDVGQKFMLEPAFLLNTVKGNPLSADFRFTVDYSRIAQLGIGYRTDGAVILAAGVGITPLLNLNYNFDIITSSLKQAASGSHEIQLNFLLFYNEMYKNDRKRYRLNLVKKPKSKPQDPNN